MKALYTRQPLVQIPIRLGRLWPGYRCSRYGGVRVPKLVRDRTCSTVGTTGFANRLIEEGFSVNKVSIDDLFDESDVLRYGFNREAIYFGTKPS